MKRVIGTRFIVSDMRNFGTPCVEIGETRQQ